MASLTPDPVFYKSCITCDAIDTGKYRRPWCKKRRCYVWASGCCTMWHRKGTGNEEDYGENVVGSHGGLPLNNGRPVYSRMPGTREAMRR